MSRSLGRKLLGYGIVAAAIVFLYLTIARNWRELRTFDWQVEPALLLASVMAHVAVLAWGVFIWSRVLRLFSAPRLSYSRLLRIWATSNMTRYIPGAIWQFLTAAHLSRGAGLPGVLALTSMLVHVGFTLLAAVAVSAATLPLAFDLGVLSSAWVRWAIVGGAVLLVHPALVNGALRLVPRALHRQVLVWTGSWWDGIVLLLLAAVSWIVYGIAFTLFVASLAPVPVTAVVPLIAVNALSFTAGYIAVLAPGGIGVRESAMTLLLSPLLPAGVAAILAVGARLWSIAAELLLAAAGALAPGRAEPSAAE